MTELTPEGAKRQYAKMLAGLPNAIQKNDVVTFHDTHNNMIGMQKNLGDLKKHVENLDRDLHRARGRIADLEEAQSDDVVKRLNAKAKAYSAGYDKACDDMKESTHEH